MGSSVREDEEQEPRKNQPRATRGLRMTKLLDEEQEADEQFWGQNAFQEEEHDVDFREADAPKQEDIFDSDFDEDEPDEEGDDEEAALRKKERRKKKPLGYGIGKKSKQGSGRKPQLPKKTVAAAGKVGQAEKRADPNVEQDIEQGEEDEKPDREEVGKAGDSAGGDRPAEMGEKGSGDKVEDFDVYEAFGSRRKSSRTAVVERALEREAQLAHKARMGANKVVKRRKAEDDRRLTQEDMLLEAAQTEIYNLGRLEVMLAREEEVKRKAVVEKALYGGAQIKFRSKDGTSVLEFTQVSHLPAVINAKAPPYPTKNACIVTGRPAKYRDPLTGLPYADAGAFKILRSRWRQRNMVKGKGQPRPIG